MEIATRTRSGRVIKKPNRYEPVEIPLDDFKSDQYESEDDDEDDEDVDSLGTEDEEEEEDGSDGDSFIDDSD